MKKADLRAIWARSRGDARYDVASRVVVELVAFEVGRDPSAITGPGRSALLRWAREVAVFVLHRHTDAALDQVAQLLARSRRDAVNLLARAEAGSSDGEFARLVRIVTAALEAA